MMQTKGSSKITGKDWLQNYWRPMMGWQYMVTCTFDFVIFPILFALIQILFDGKVDQQWSPITLEGAGLYHLAMGAILGVAAWSRGQEKMFSIKNDLRKPKTSDEES